MKLEQLQQHKQQNLPLDIQLKQPLEWLVTAQKYIDHVLDPMITNVDERRNNKSTRASNNSRIRPLFDDVDDWIFEQDHARAHTAYATQEYLADQTSDHFSVDDAPSKLDDLWAIERIWGVISEIVHVDPQPQTLKVLEARIRIAWDNLSPGLLTRAVHQMRHRAKAIINAGGDKLINFKISCKCNKCKRSRSK